MNVLEAYNITKYFPGVTALDNVSIAFERGKIHAIIGENGAGKSALIRCLTGVLEPSSGTIKIDGQPAAENPKLFNKIAYVPQEINLLPQMSVAENLFIPFEKTDTGRIVSQKVLQEKARPILEKFCIALDGSELVKDISVSQQQLVQIARATVYRDYDVLVLDEPTTSLTTRDTKKLFSVIRKIRDENKAVVFISHKLEEIFELCDVVSVFRNGKKIAVDAVKNVDEQWIISRMTGHTIDMQEAFTSTKVSQKVLMEVKNLTGGKFTNVSFSLKEGEILGLSGLVGAGRSEVMQAVFGYLPVYAGSVTIDGIKWKLGDTSFSVQHGLIYLPEERKSQGILPILSIRENISISQLDSVSGRFGIRLPDEEALAEKIIGTYNISTPDIEYQIKFLSGGNQQKVIIGRAMSCNPKVLIFDEPTKGIDVVTKTEIYRLMKKLVETERIGIILISSEMNEIIKCSNRILTFCEGRKVGEFSEGTDKNILLGSIIGSKTVSKEKCSNE
ncbi:MAG: sugar ABC transporter ATP-binding protein [Treponema sp.]